MSSPTRPKLKPQVILLGIVSLLNDSASEMIYPLLPVFLTTTLGASAIVVGLIEGGADALASVLKLWAGTWSDRVRRRKPMIAIGYTLAAGSRALIGVASSWTAVLTARLVDRTGKGIRSAPRDAMISDVTAPDQRGRAYGFHRALDHTGAIIGPLLAMLLMQGLGVSTRHIFLLAVIPGAIAVLLIVLFLREPERHIPAVHKDEPRLPLPRPFWTAVAAIGVFALANSSDAFLILQAHQAGVPTGLLPLLWAAHHVVKSLFSTWAGGLSDRGRRRGMLAIGWCTYALTYIFFPYARTMTSFFVLFIFYAVPFTLTEGAERALISDLVPAEVRGRSFGIYYLVTGLGVLGGSALFGWLYQTVSVQAAFRTGAGLALAAAVLVTITRPRAELQAS